MCTNARVTLAALLVAAPVAVASQQAKPVDMSAPAQ
jgi:hypothetical protein